MLRKAYHRGGWLLNGFIVTCVGASMAVPALTGYSLLYPQSRFLPLPPPDNYPLLAAAGALATSPGGPAILEDPPPMLALASTTPQPSPDGLGVVVEQPSTGDSPPHPFSGVPTPIQDVQAEESATLSSADDSVRSPAPTSTAASSLPTRLSMPECAEHDPNAYHGLIDEGKNCHYDHAHGMPEPSWARALFGDRIVDYIWTVSYPWETPGENLKKHAGYTMHAYDFRDFGCVMRNDVPSVDAYIAETHGAAIGAGKLARFHSFALAAELCDERGSAGTIFTGGFEDYGQLTSPYKGNFVSYPKFNEQDYAVGLPPYVGEARAGGSAQNETWNSAHRAGSEPYVDEHQIANIAFRIRDAVDYVNPNTRLSGEPIFISFDEPWSDSSEHQLYQIEITVPDLNGDGSPVTGHFFTDVHGNLAPDCSGPSESCVPLILQDATPGSYSFNGNATGQIDSVFQADSFYEEDVWFCGIEVCAPHSDGAVPSGWIDLSRFGSGP